MGEIEPLAAWKLPVIVAAIAVSIVGGFYLGGPGLGMAVGALAAGSIIVLAVRCPPQPPIFPPIPRDYRRHLLILSAEPLEDPGTIEQIVLAATATEDDRGQPEVLVLAPVRNRFLDRWTSDCRPGRDRAERTLVVSLASLAAAGVTASAALGEEGLVQALEDQLGSFPATAVILVSGRPERDGAADLAARELERRLQVPFRHFLARSSEPPTRPAVPDRARVSA